MIFLTRSHRLAALCGAIPLSLGTGIFVIWLVGRWDWLMFAGAVVLYGGVAVVVVGAIALAHGCWVASRSTTVSRHGMWMSTLGCAGLLLVNLPVAAGIIAAAVAIMARYTVVVSNTSQERLDNVRVLGGGCDAGFGSMAAGTVARRSFWIRHDGVLVFRASRGADTIEHVIDPYVTNDGGGHTTVTMQRNDKIVVTHLAVRELAWADRIRDELFWLNHAACAASARSNTRRLTRVAPDGRPGAADRPLVNAGREADNSYRSPSMMRYVVALLIAATGAFAAQSAGDVALSLTRQYGRALYRDCRLDVTVYRGQGRIALQCAFNIEPSKSLRAARTLTPDEARAVSVLVGASDLCGSGHTGRDDRAGDGELETLQTNCLDGNVAVLVTSGNPTFKTQDARRQLIGRLYAMEDELRKSAAPQK